MSRSLPIMGFCILVLAIYGNRGAAQNAPLQAVVTISLDDALRRAETNEPIFATAAAERRATGLERKDAVAALLPTAAVHNQYLFTQSNHSRAVTTQGGVNQSLPVFIANNSLHEYVSQGTVTETVGLAKVGALRLADANAARAEAELEVSRRGLVSTVVSLYYGLQAANQRLTIAERALNEAEGFLDTTTKREAARESAHADVIKSRLVQQQRRRELAEAQLAVSRSGIELGVLLFADPSTTYTLAPPAAAAVLPEREAVAAAARLNNPELRSALAALQISQAETLNAQSALLPDLALNFTYGIDAPQLAKHGPDDARNLGYSASATIDFPVWDWLTGFRKVKEARIRSDAVKTTLSATQRRLIADLHEFYDEADSAGRQLASLDATVIDARESLRLSNLRYVDGEGTVLDVVDAQNTLTTAENASAEGTVRYQVALAQLQTLTGRL